MVRLRTLEALFVSVQRAAGALAEVDGFDRWGRSNATPEQVARYDEQERANRLIYDRDKAALLAEVTSLRVTAPDVVARWVALHVQLLEEVAVRDPRLAATVKYERELWTAFAEARKSFDELIYSNAGVDPARRRELLGDAP